MGYSFLSFTRREPRAPASSAFIIGKKPAKGKAEKGYEIHKKLTNFFAT